jgi:hypothetical protein
LLLSVVCPLLIPVLVAQATVDIAKKIKPTPIKHQKQIEYPIVNKFISELTEAVHDNNTAGVAQATVNYLFNVADPNLLGEYQDKKGLKFELQYELNVFVQRIQIMELSIDREEPPTDQYTRNPRQPLDIFLDILSKNMKYIPLDQLENTKIALTKLEQTLEEHAKKLPQIELAEFKEYLYMISNSY